MIASILLVITFLTAMTSCKAEDSTQNVTSLHNDTIEDKALSKRQTIDVGVSAAGQEDENSQTGILGINSLGIQIVGGLLQNVFSNQGVTPQVATSALNLLNPQSIKQDLLLLRRGFNILARLGILVNKYLPNPTAGDSSKPLDILSNKIRFYEPEQPELIHWVPKNRNRTSGSLADVVPERIQSLVEFATENSTVESSQSVNVTASSGSAESANIEIINVNASPTPDATISIVEKETTSESTPASNLIVVQVETSTSTTTSSSVANVGPVNNSIAVSVNSSQPKDVEAPTKIQIPNQYGLTTQHSGLYAGPQVDIKNVLPYGPYFVAPHPYGLPPNPFFAPNQGYAIPGPAPIYVGYPDIRQGNYASVADLPLERNTIYDRRQKGLQDSFGNPVKSE